MRIANLRALVALSIAVVACDRSPTNLMPLEDPAGVARLVADFARKHPIPPGRS